MALEALCAAFDEDDGKEERMDGQDECVPDDELSVLADLLAKDEEEELLDPKPRDSTSAGENVTANEPNKEDEEDSVAAMKAKMARLERELAELKSQVKTNSSSKVTPTTSSLHSSSERKRSSVAAAVGSNGCPSSKRRSLVKEDEEGVVMRRRGGAKARLAHASDDENCFTDRFSGIKIRNPLVSSVTMKQRMESRKMIHLPRLASHVKDGDIEGDWVTIGVIVKKLPPRDTKKGEKYSIWHLSNLSISSTVSLFLFGNVYKEHWKTPLGNVVALLNATIMTDRESNCSVGVSGTSQYSLKLDHPAKLMQMGLSEDYTICKSTTKSGNPCQNFASKSHGGVCDYHVQNAYRKATNKRSELQTSNFTPALTDMQTKLRKLSRGAAAMSSPGPVQGGGVGMTSYQLKEKTSKEVKRLMGEVREVRGDGDLKFKSGVTMQHGSDLFKQLLQQQSVGARLINSCLKKEEIKKEGTGHEPKSAAQLLLEHSKSTSTKQTAQNIAKPSQCFKEDKQNMKAKTAECLKEVKPTKAAVPSLSCKDDFGSQLFTPDRITAPRTHSESSSRSLPSIRKQSSIATSTPSSVASSCPPTSSTSFSSSVSSSTIDDAPRRGLRYISSLPLSQQKSGTIQRPSKADISKLKALSVVKEKDLLDQEHDQNCLSPKELSTAQRIKVQTALDKSFSEENASSAATGGGRFSLGSKELQEILDARSSHEWIVEEDERKVEDKYFAGLEKKEAVEERLRNLKELKVKVVQCKECAYTAESPGELCRKENHTLSRMRAIKRCFQCQGCQQRKFTYSEHYPSQPCRCGEYHFLQTSLSYVRKGPSLPSEELQVRGHEEKFLK